MPTRIEALALAAGLGRDAAHSQLASAFDAVLHLGREARRGGIRRLVEIAVPRREPSGLVVMETAVSWEASVLREGPAVDRLTELLA